MAVMSHFETPKDARRTINRVIDSHLEAFCAHGARACLRENLPDCVHFVATTVCLGKGERTATVRQDCEETP